ncbi:terminase gpA endonuclease subunit [Bradyrhizobium sp. CCBAU 051011]|uniref:terminase gpA endonuclease subunit n=1 Tax=Bradyrhizobium sp. CCBAU 051011 TaxID=858422 RepID=UPI001379F7E9|nr:terminase gpA endonuclease subunit [Bradyrhizobium sp. CCBAU 051011]
MVGDRLRGDTADTEVWDQLAELISTPIDGFPIHLTFVDSGFRPGKADTLPLNRVYEFCRRFPKRVRPTKGSSAPMRVPLSKIEVNPSGKAAKFGLDLVRLDTDHWKCLVHERLRWPSETPGAWNVPVGIDDDYCHQIVSEAQVKSPTGRREWIRRSKNNHFLDCEAMLAATSYLMNM